MNLYKSLLIELTIKVIFTINETKWTILFVFDNKSTLEESEEMSCSFSFFFFVSTLKMTLD
jgi:hypothetical protein